jgi:hypothetical protein
MHLAQHVAPLGDRLVVLGREFTDDANESYLIAHKALRSLLAHDGPLSDAEPADLRTAVSRAAKALGIRQRKAQQRSPSGLTHSRPSAAMAAPSSTISSRA